MPALRLIKLSQPIKQWVIGNRIDDENSIRDGSVDNAGNDNEVNYKTSAGW